MWFDKGSVPSIDKSVDGGQSRYVRDAPSPLPFPSTPREYSDKGSVPSIDKSVDGGQSRYVRDAPSPLPFPSTPREYSERGRSQIKLMNALYRNLLLVVSAGLGCTASLGAQVDHSTDYLPAPPQGQRWQLAWHDEFDGPQLDPSKWELCGDSKRRDGFWVKEDSYLDGQGHLLLRTKRDGDRYTCGAVRTRGKFEHAYGYWVARCKFPTEPGHWPAFWLFCGGVGKVGNGGRDGTEIDIMEAPWRNGKITMNLHWDGYGKDHQHAGTTTTLPALTNGFHTFALLWTTNEYVFFTDGQETWRSSAGGVSQVPEYLKLTEEIGAWGGDIKRAKLPDYFVVDYVRIYDAVPK